LFSYQASRLPEFQTANRGHKPTTTSTNTKKHAWHKLFLSTNSSDSTVTTQHMVSIDWQSEQCQAFSNIRNDFFQMRDRLRATDKNYKVAKLKTANHFWKFCFGDEIPFQSPLSSLETTDQEQTQNPLPTMKKMITLTQVLVE
jgi:hypothetical protein